MRGPNARDGSTAECVAKGCAAGEKDSLDNVIKIIAVLFSRCKREFNEGEDPVTIC